YGAAMSDGAGIFRGQATMFLGGPALGKASIGEDVTAEELGGGDLHARTSGVVDHLAEDDAHALAILRDAVAALPPPTPPVWQVREPRPPAVDPATLYGAVSTDLRAAQDPREIIARIVDGSQVHEFQARYGTALVTCFADKHGHAVGMVDNYGGLLSECALKGAHFI